MFTANERGELVVVVVVVAAAAAAAAAVVAVVTVVRGGLGTRKNTNLWSNSFLQ